MQSLAARSLGKALQAKALERVANFERRRGD